MRRGEGARGHHPYLVCGCGHGRWYRLFFVPESCDQHLVTRIASSTWDVCKSSVNSPLGRFSGACELVWDCMAGAGKDQTLAEEAGGVSSREAARPGLRCPSRLKHCSVRAKQADVSRIERHIPDGQQPGNGTKVLPSDRTCYRARTRDLRLELLRLPGEIVRYCVQLNGFDVQHDVRLSQCVLQFLQIHKPDLRSVLHG